MNMQPSWSRHISPLAKKLARDLINELSIQPGFDLSFFLDVDNRYDNYQSVRIWVQRMLDHEIDEPSDLFAILTRLFTKCIPAAN